ncbi:hypothetical protein U9M48_010893 [Paspalum notatum var. saurae]|uniref:UDP-glycosyltransferases domain-containing protein n=1 Tax=Paspalum notatum var. saurae TaxID=547442 RepID=A0AAQ3SW01_PASNO
MDEAATTKLDVVLFPWLAFGHMIPYLELAKRLAARGHAVTFLSTPRNVARLPPVPADLSPRLRFVALPPPTVEGLPEGAESTADVPPEKNELIKKAADGLAAPFAAFLAGAVAGGRRPDWLIIDFCHRWIPPIAEENKVPCAAFLIVQATTIAFLGPRWAQAAHPRAALEDFVVPPKWCPSWPPAVAYSRHEAAWAVGTFQRKASGVSDMDRTWEIIEHTRFTIYRSCDEVEPGAFAHLTDLFRKPAVPAGVLLQPDDPAPADGDATSISRSAGVRSEVLQWLDSQPPKSVIYAALGSEAPLTANNLQELALGLELAGVRFLWAFRKPTGMSAPSGADAAELLPAGFEDRTRGRGLVWSGWVPQVAVLAHAAVGAFLTHCGWGSTVESLVFGRPLVMLPFVVDQGLIARTMAERGVGVEVARDEGDGSFSRECVAAAVRVMVEEEGKVFESNAARLKEAFGDQRRQDQYMDELVGFAAAPVDMHAVVVAMAPQVHPCAGSFALTEEHMGRRLHPKMHMRKDCFLIENLRGEEKRRFVLLPARKPISFVSDGSLSLGGEGDRRFSVRRCRLGPSSASRFVFPGYSGETVAVGWPWNKSFRFRPRFVGVHSDAVEGSVKAELTGAGRLAAARFAPDLDVSDVGVGSLAFRQGLLLVPVELHREMAGGIVVARLVVLCFFLIACRRRAQVHSQRSTGCVPGRCSFMLFILCGSLQSHRAMVLLPALASLPSSPFSSSGAPVEAGGPFVQSGWTAVSSGLV